MQAILAEQSLPLVPKAKFRCVLANVHDAGGVCKDCLSYDILCDVLYIIYHILSVIHQIIYHILIYIILYFNIFCII